MQRRPTPLPTIALAAVVILLHAIPLVAQSPSKNTSEKGASTKSAPAPSARSTSALPSKSAPSASALRATSPLSTANPLSATAPSPTDGAIATSELLAATTITFAANDSKACLRCHGMPGFGFRERAGGPVRQLAVPADSFATSAHGKLECRSCHADVTRFPHDTTRVRRAVGCADDCHATDSTGSPYTHRRTVSTYASSAHRGGLDGTNRDAPTCATCHESPHTLRRAAKAVPIGERMAMCVGCHDDEARMKRNHVATNAVESYRRSFHYKAIRFGETNTAVCQDCHTVHGALPADSVRSSIARGNVAQTCGRSDCHPGAAMNFAMSGANHLDLRIERSALLWIEERFFLVLTGGTMAMLLVGIVLDIQRRFNWLTLARRATTTLAHATTTAAKATWRLLRALLWA